MASREVRDRNTERVLETARQVVGQRWQGRPRFGIILGTGAGEVARNIDPVAEIPYAEIPGFPRSTALGHKGQLVCGQLAGHDLMAMQGRFHPYEGYTGEQIRLPIELMSSLGVEVLFISNAAGGLNPRFQSGQLMVLESHLDLMFRAWPVAGSAWPLAGSALPRERPLARTDVYDRQLIEGALARARHLGFVLQRGVYAAMSGPSYETRAEYRFLRKVGADVVGMSTVPEVVAAAALGLRVLVFSMVANVANPDELQATSGQEVVAAAAVAAPRLCELVVHAMQQA